MSGDNFAKGLVIFDKIVNLGNRLVECYETSKRLDAEMKKIDSETRVSLAEVKKEKLKINKAYRLCRESIKNFNNNYLQTFNELSCNGEEFRKCIAEYNKNISKAFDVMITTQDVEMKQLMQDSIHNFQENIKELADRLKVNNDQILTNASQHIKELPNIKDTKLISDR